MADLIVAASPELVDDDEHAFVEHIAGPRGRWETYSSILTSADCVEIDRRAYRGGRSWFLDADGSDPTRVDGVSLGRAYEWAATTELVRLHRAGRVLERLAQARPGMSVQLRGVTREWAFAADALGLRLHGQRPHATGPLFGTNIAKAQGYVRAAGALLALGSRRPQAGFVYGRSWAIEHARAVAKRWPLVTVEPGPKYLLALLLAGRRMRTSWLHNAGRQADPSPSPSAAASHPYFGDLWRSAVGDLAHAQRFGRALGSRVNILVACQDVLPPERALLLGAKAAGARVVTLEHGISGGFVDQIQTLGDVLGVWGEPHRAYHQPLAPESTRVELVGWPRLEGRRSSRAEPRWDVVFFAQPSQDLGAGSWPEDQLQTLEIVEAYAASHPKRRVGVKFHPSMGAFGWGIPTLRHCQRVHGDSLRVLRRSRAAVLTLSTTGIEAMALGVPVVSLETRGKLGGVNFIAESGAPVAEDAHELAGFLEPLFADRDEYERAAHRGSEYAHRFIAGLDQPGRASRRLIAILETIGTR